MEGRMRDVGVWKIVRFSGIVAGSAFVLSGCIGGSSAKALALPSVDVAQTLTVDTTATLKAVIASPQKDTSSAVPSSPASAASPSAVVSHPAASPARSSSASTSATSPSSADTTVPPPSQSAAVSGYDGEAFDDSLTQPFILADVARWPYVAGFTMNTGVEAVASHSVFIEATPQGWRIGGVLWYWWMGLLGFIAVTIRECAYLIPRYLQHKV